jgi:hypothetical protein
MREFLEQDPLAVLGYLDSVNLQVELRVAAKAISSHTATSSALPFA